MLCSPLLLCRGISYRVSLVLKVECYSGYKADERPLRFTPSAPGGPPSRPLRDSGSPTLQSSGDGAPQGGRTYEVQEVLDQWYGVGYRCFKVRADDDNLYILRHSVGDDLWTLDSFRRHSERS